MDARAPCPFPLPPAWAVGGEGVGVTSWVPSSSHCSLLGERVSRWWWYRVNELAQRLCALVSCICRTGVVHGHLGSCLGRALGLRRCRIEGRPPLLRVFLVSGVLL